MIANVLLITIAILLALGFWLMGELRFLVPYKLALWRAYATPILIYAGILAANVFAAVFVLIRKFFNGYIFCELYFRNSFCNKERNR